MAQQATSLLQEQLGRNIKEIITEFPAVGDVLEVYDIGCVSCGLGTCKFRDIVEIHALDPDDEAALMISVGAIMFPGRQTTVPSIERRSQPPGAQAAYSPPMKELVEEHRLIKRWLAIIPCIVDSLDLNLEEDRELIRNGIDFIRSYADSFHHAKEEAILFRYFDENLDIIKTICADHENARARVRLALAALNAGDREAVATQLMAYRDLLTEHIKKEDEVLYRWMDRNLSMKQVGELFSRFQETDREFGDVPHRYQQLVSRLEGEYRQAG